MCFPGVLHFSPYGPSLPAQLIGVLFCALGLSASHSVTHVPVQPCTPNADLFPQVAMGYSHSLVIARDESETEKEKIKKLPEYNPRTL